jgi:hypothetical protein
VINNGVIILESSKAAIKNMTGNEDVLLWLPPAELAQLAKWRVKLAARHIYLSGVLMEEDLKHFPESWQSRLRVIDPYELGSLRSTNVTRLQQWLQTWQKRLLNEAFHMEVFFNLLFS